MLMEIKEYLKIDEKKDTEEIKNMFRYIFVNTSKIRYILPSKNHDNYWVLYMDDGESFTIDLQTIKDISIR